MKKTGPVSTLMLERYRPGEASARERKLVEAELASNSALRVHYEALESQDRDLRQRYPWEQSSFKTISAAADSRSAAGKTSRFPRMIRFPAGKRLLALCAAALLLFALSRLSIF